ncbi:MAG: hypothetical protein NTU53_02615 [Planctomycetota bacterium]|nr:hypothetical protein [Planctomycetota bacterium]
MPSFIESLESRLFLSASPLTTTAPHNLAPAIHAKPLAAPKQAPATINLANLLGYSRRGASWNYNTTYKLTSSEGTDSGSGTGQVSVARRTTQIDGHASNLVTVSAADTTLSTAWFSDATGTNVNAIATNTDLGKINLTLHDTRIAPKSLTIGKSYSDNGTFDGKFTVSTNGINATGTLSGNTTATTKLIGTEQITVPAGTFNAIKGTYTIKMTGTLRIRYQGKTISVKFSATVNQTFFAVQGTGIVKGTTSATIKITVPSWGPESASATIATALTSFK